MTDDRGRAQALAEWALEYGDIVLDALRWQQRVKLLEARAELAAEVLAGKHDA